MLVMVPYTAVVSFLLNFHPLRFFQFQFHFFIHNSHFVHCDKSMPPDSARANGSSATLVNSGWVVIMILKILRSNMTGRVRDIMEISEQEKEHAEWSAKLAGNL